MSCVLSRDFGGNSNVTARGAREGKHVRRIIFAAETAVELLQALVVRDQDVHLAGNPCQLLRLAGKALYSRSTHANHRGFKNDHRVFSKTNREGPNRPPSRNSTKFLLLQRGLIGLLLRFSRQLKRELLVA